MNKIYFFIFGTLICSNLNAQVPAFDKLERLYDQHHYKLVLRKSNRLLDIPDYDYSFIPELYKGMALLQMSRKETWHAHHEDAINEAELLLVAVKRSTVYRQILDAHMHELSELKNDLNTYAADLKRLKKEKTLNEIEHILLVFFKDIASISEPYISEDSRLEDEDFERADNFSKDRLNLEKYARNYLGVPYQWSGDSPSGFDCSGFMCYVHKEIGKEIPRRAADQYEQSTKLKEKNVQKGDLVFFNNGSGVSHVGMIISKKGKPLIMIHSSSSNGVVITEIEQSAYWKKRLFGFGTFLH